MRPPPLSFPGANWSRPTRRWLPGQRLRGVCFGHMSDAWYPRYSGSGGSNLQDGDVTDGCPSGPPGSTLGRLYDHLACVLLHGLIGAGDELSHELAYHHLTCQPGYGATVISIPAAVNALAATAAVAFGRQLGAGGPSRHQRQPLAHHRKHRPRRARPHTIHASRPTRHSLRPLNSLSSRDIDMNPCGIIGRGLLA